MEMLPCDSYMIFSVLSHVRYSFLMREKVVVFDRICYSSLQFGTGNSVCSNVIDGNNITVMAIKSVNIIVSA